MFRIETSCHFGRESLCRGLRSHNLLVADEIGPLYNACGKRSMRPARVRQRMDEIISMQSVVILRRLSGAAKRA